MSEQTNSNAMTETRFWELVAEIGWPDVDIAKAKLAFMRRHDCKVAEAFRRQFYKRQDDLAREAAVDWCCDSWEYVRSHIVGLGQAEFDRHMRTPRLIIDREQAGNYVEGFAYCIPVGDDYELLGDDGYGHRLQKVREFVAHLDAADEDEIPPRLYRRFDEALDVCRLLMDKDWRAAVIAYHEAYGRGYADDWPFSDWCGYLVPNIVLDLERYRLQ